MDLALWKKITRGFALLIWIGISRRGYPILWSNQLSITIDIHSFLFEFYISLLQIFILHVTFQMIDSSQIYGWESPFKKGLIHYIILFQGFLFLFNQIRDNINVRQTCNLVFSLCRWNEGLANAVSFQNLCTWQQKTCYKEKLYRHDILNVNSGLGSAVRLEIVILLFYLLKSVAY